MKEVLSEAKEDESDWDQRSKIEGKIEPQERIQLRFLYEGNKS
jgi:hypothetical protein